MDLRTIMLGVFIDLIAAPFCYEGSAALMGKQWIKALVAYALGIPLALLGLSIAGVFNTSITTGIRAAIYPIAGDARWWLIVLLFVLLWIGGPRFVQRMKTALGKAPAALPEVNPAQPIDRNHPMERRRRNMFSPVERLLEELNPTVGFGILSMRDEGNVSRRQTIHGYVTPGNHPVQVFVYSYGSGVWYRQGDAHVDWEHWSIECQFGNEKTEPGSHFKIVAVDGYPALGPRIASIPDGIIKSHILTVTLILAGGY